MLDKKFAWINLRIRGVCMDNILPKEQILGVKEDVAAGQSLFINIVSSISPSERTLPQSI